MNLKQIYGRNSKKWNEVYKKLYLLYESFKKNEKEVKNYERK